MAQEQPELQPSPRPSARPQFQPIPKLVRPESGPASATWVKIAAAAAISAGLTAALVFRGAPHKTAALPAFASRPQPIAAAAAAPAQLTMPSQVPAAAFKQALETMELPFAPQALQSPVEDGLVPYRPPAEPAAVPAQPAAPSLVQAAPRAPLKFNNDIFGRPQRQQAPPAVLAAQAQKTWIPAPCDWKVSAPGYQCWDSGGLLIKNQGVQQSGVKVTAQQGPSGIWYQPPGTANKAQTAPPAQPGQSAPPPAAPAKK
jgi:hypothetical protein